MKRNTDAIVRLAREKSHNTRQRVLMALQELQRQGRPITFAVVCQAAHVSKTFLYDPHQADLAAEIRRLRDLPRSPGRDTAATTRDSRLFHVQWSREQSNVPYVAYTTMPGFFWLHHTVLPISIDEAFSDLTDCTHENLTELGQEIRASVLQRTDIPISVGIAPTKSLTKIATETAKKQTSSDGVVNLCGLTEQDIDAYLAAIPVEDVWGIGRKRALFLTNYGITRQRPEIRRCEMGETTLDHRW
ncbi:MAG: Y-family DNA polymerase [Ktedonobacteraceae bacterium]